MIDHAEILGKLERFDNFPSRYVNPRPVDVWLPPGTIQAAGSLPVIYMQDGQNLFDPALAFGGIDWGIDETVVSLLNAGRIQPVMIVAIWNSPDRLREYMPQKPFERSQRIRACFQRMTGKPPFSDNYLRFLVEELKPFIDQRYPTQADPGHTFVMGSSMGGLVSLYAVESYPQVFGGAGCISTHWLAGLNSLVDSFGAALPPPGRHRFYFDYGTATLDEGYEPYQLRMDGYLHKAGYLEGKDWVTRKFDGAAHNEASWSQRVHIPLEFLLSR